MNIPTEIFSHLSHNNPPTSVTSIMNTLQAPRVRYKLSPKKIIRLILILLLITSGILMFCSKGDNDSTHTPASQPSPTDTILKHSRHVDGLLSHPRKPLVMNDKNGNPVKTKITGVGDYNEAFPDMNDIQLATATRLGIDRIANREAAHHSKDKLVCITDNPYYRVHHLSHSIPYLVPRAQRLLTEISRNFIDSLQRKGLPFYKLIVTSVLRTEEDVRRLRRVNCNASENSCHQHGTTFDICYNSFHRVISPNDSEAKQVWDGRLKDVLAEVLRDLRSQGVCYVRYEARQACFHITAR